MIPTQNKKIAKNTFFLYTRTFFLLAISLITSRLLLKNLGVEDLGIYNVVGGIVSIMYFLRAAQSRATTRFITFELGANPDFKESNIFPICFTIHIILSLFVLFIGETLGFFILNYWTNIPADRILAAHLVYHFSLILFCVNILRIPFDSIVISNENMQYYAYVSIIEVIMQFLGVVMLKYYSGDRLIAYSFLLLLVSLVIFTLYYFIIRKFYGRYKIKWRWNRKESLAILSFSGWSLLGSTSDTIAQQGVSLIFNNFVNLIANTALGFANQVRSAIGTFVGSFTLAFDPQIIKLTAEKDKMSLQQLIMRASKLSFVLAFMIAFPLLLNLDFLLSLWLGDVPQYTRDFCFIVIVSALFDATSCFFNTAINATGDIKKYQIFISFSFLFDFICTFTLLYVGLNPAVAFSSRIFARGIINMIIGLYFCYKQIDFNIKIYVTKVLIPIILTSIVSISICYFFATMYDGWHKLVISTIASSVTIILCLLYFVLTKQERVSAMKLINDKIHQLIR